MSHRIKLKHLENSTLSGLEAEFTGPVVKIGTSAAAHICFDPDDDPGVASSHAELRLDAGGAVIALGKDNAPVSVNGEAVEKESALKTGDVVVLGEGGPGFEVLAIESVGDSSPVNTIVGSRASQPPKKPLPPKTPKPGKSPGAPSSPPPSSPATIVGQRVTPPSADADGLPPVRPNFGGASTGNTPPPTPAEQTPSESSGKRFKKEKKKKDKPATDSGSLGLTQKMQSGQAIGANTLMGVIGKVRGEERKRQTRMLLAGLALVLIASVVAAVVLTGGKEESWEEVAEKVKPSVCVVMTIYPALGEKPDAGGTAWSVGEGVFATNAHVAESFLQYKDIDKDKRPKMIIRTPGKEPQDMVVTKVVLHPGYGDWLEMLREYNPFDPGEKKFLVNNSFPSCDVALMYIDEDDYDKQPPPLELASESEIDQLKIGSPIASIGYPQEGLAINTEKPEPDSSFGELRKAGDFFLSAANPQEADFYWYTWPSAGGASGSPVVNDEGKVISLLSAGNVVGTVGGKRVSVGGTSLGPQVKFVKELLEDTADKEQKARKKAWRKQMRKMHDEGVESPELLARARIYTLLTAKLEMKQGTFDLLRIKENDKKVKLKVSNGKGSVSTDSLLFPAGLNIAIAITENGPIPIYIQLPGSTSKPNEKKLSYISMLDLVPKNNAKASLEINAGKDAEDGTYDVLLYVYHIKQ